MSVSDMLRADAAAIESESEYSTAEIEKYEARLVDLRRKRDDERLRRAELLAAAAFLDNAGFKVERDAKGLVNVSVNGGTP